MIRKVKTIMRRRAIRLLTILPCPNGAGILSTEQRAHRSESTVRKHSVRLAGV